MQRKKQMAANGQTIPFTKVKEPLAICFKEKEPTDFTNPKSIGSLFSNNASLTKNYHNFYFESLAKVPVDFNRRYAWLRCQ